MKNYNELRELYSNFYYHGFNYTDDGNFINVTYDFEIENLARFNPTLKVPYNSKLNYDDGMLKKIIFSAGLAEIPSYWKPTCSKNIVIECGTLDEYQTSWLKKLLYNGLGEFFYVNNIKPDYDSFVSITSNGDNYDVKDTRTYDGYLVAVGGGKDSVTSLQILKNIKNKKAFIINNRKICFDSACSTGMKNEDIINVERVFDRKLIDLNKEGYLNGHTPISSCIAFISYLTAYLNDIKYVVLSNESSANESSVKGTNINHQYSKSLEFENDFREYTFKYLTKNIEYFSLLRPLSELQIMKIFSKYPECFTKFISCNNGGKSKNIGKTDGWCLSCAKCLFIYIIMRNFIDTKTLVEVFGEDLFDKKEMLPYFLELLGKTESKPFECVGTIEEVTYVVNNLAKGNEKLPYLLRYYKDNYGVMEQSNDILNRIDSNNNVPSELLNLILEELK